MFVFASTFGLNATNRQLSVIDSLIKVGDFSEAQKLSLQMLKTAAETGDCANEVMANFKNAEIVALLKDDFQAIQFCQDGIAKAKIVMQIQPTGFASGIWGIVFWS